MSELAEVLGAIESGDPRAIDQLLPLVYAELRRLAAKKLRDEPAGQTLQPTALVHEAYLRLVGSAPQTWHGRPHFFAAAAEAMRRILIDNARRKGRLKRGGGRRRLNLDQVDLAATASCDELVALHDALGQLAEEDPVKAELVRLRYFAGLTLERGFGVVDMAEQETPVRRKVALKTQALFAEAEALIEPALPDKLSLKRDTRHDH